MVEEGKSWDELYTFDLMPSKLFLKFKKEIQGFRFGVNMEFYNAPSNEFESKLKIPVTNFLNLRVGMGHSFGLNSTSLNWKLSPCLDEYGLSRIRNKTLLGVCPSVDC
ncbi:hypothetical protein POM88_021652 [Heracleum sosnowskyi]|uniref:DUF7781 domain-containing protein n=1 Tax=Heracleum sosnowskyi TaxID=360622 RepID=A0AAD8IDK5_9APIA|nr:hypothetical protein POM88_021652 [Heracleum sosnowskyi]